MIYFQRHVDQIIQAKDNEIAAYASENVRLRDDLVKEKARADRAVDAVLKFKNAEPISREAPTKRSVAEVIETALGVMSTVGEDMPEEKHA